MKTEAPELRRERNFFDLLKKQWERGRFACVGLDIDPDSDKFPKHLLEQHQDKAKAMEMFGCIIADATHELVCAYKPNSAFYEAQGWEGMRALQNIIAYIKQQYPDISIIDDAKRGDIGNTGALYARAIFEILGADAVTLSPYLGKDAIQPFLDYAQKGCIILCRTSNPGAKEFQDIKDESGKPLWKKVAEHVRDSWNENGNCLLVVGATYPEEMMGIRKIVGDVPFLIPGIGKQGGDVNAAVQAGVDSNKQGVIINSSSAVIYASSGKDFAQAARTATEELHAAINNARSLK